MEVPYGAMSATAVAAASRPRSGLELVMRIAMKPNDNQSVA